ncbi:hypothetical protein Rhal01_01067 [Rubritalea halochordaticola]|uniref:DUF7088 domain-containing protein n=1 Tax=Rubritalea halochordaticola TaxID=714537 RepID=A0ABP9V2P7_9BACT
MAEDTSKPADNAPDEDTSLVEETPSNGKVRSINRLGIGTMAVLQIIFAFSSVILLNYLSCTKHQRYDLSQHKDYSLSSRSQTYLASEEVSARSTPVKMVALIKQQSPYYLRLRAQLENYKRFANDHLDLEFVDPIRDPQRAQEASTTYQRNLTEEMIIIDARTETQLEERSEEESRIDLATHVRTVPVKSLFIEEMDRYNHSYISTWRDEDLLTTYLVSAIEGKPRKFYFVVDKSQIDDKAEGTPAWKTFQQLLLMQNIQLAPLQISTTQSIPQDAEGLAIIGPSFDFDEREIKTLSEYWDRESSAIFITLDPEAKLNNLKRFLREYGITPQDNRVISVSGNQTLTATRAIFNQGPTVNKDLAFQATQFDGSTSSLEVASNDDRLNIRNITPFPLIQAAEGWWGETRYTEPNPTFDPKEDLGTPKGAPSETPVPVAAAVLRGLENNDRTINLTSRMVVIGNTDYLKPNNMREELTHFTNSSLNWLVGRENLIGIGPKPVTNQKVTVQSAHKSFIDQLVLVFMPLFALMIALVLWNSRRS